MVRWWWSVWRARGSTEEWLGQDKNCGAVLAQESKWLSCTSAVERGKTLALTSRREERGAREGWQEVRKPHSRCVRFSLDSAVHMCPSSSGSHEPDAGHPSRERSCTAMCRHTLPRDLPSPARHLETYLTPRPSSQRSLIRQTLNLF